MQTGRHIPLGQNLAHRIGLRRHGAQPLDDASDAGFVQHEPVHHGLGQALVFAKHQVFGIGGNDVVAVLPDGIGGPDQGGVPGLPLAFLTQPGQGVNYHRGTWHGVLTPLSGPGLFAVVDRIGPGANLEEHFFDTPYQVVD